MANNTINLLQTHAQLGKRSAYEQSYNPALLCPIPRAAQRQEIGITANLPFHGIDIWTGYELSWLNLKGKPIVAVAEFYFPCTSTHLIESKSFKLYLNSFNQSQFSDFASVEAILSRDLSYAAGATVTVTLFPWQQFGNLALQEFNGVCLDDLDITCQDYEVRTDFLQTKSDFVTETVFSHLLKSNCLVTAQPDWGSVCLQYEGQQIDHEGLLRYFVSFRQHHEFHEHCAERIFMDVMQHCAPEKLSVYIRYTRRGGLDINPFRSNFSENPGNNRLARQ